MGDRRIFISHSDADSDFVRQLVEDLYDRMDLEPFHILYRGKRGLRLGGIAYRPEAAIASRPIFLAVLSPEALSSEKVQRELRIAVAATRPPQSIHIFTVLCSPCEIPAELSDFPLISFIPPISRDVALQELAVPILRLQWQHEDTTKALAAGARLYRHRHFIEAATVFEGVTQKEPRHRRVWTWLGWSYHHSGLHEAALGAFEKGLTECKPSSDLYSGKAMELLELQRYEDALATVDEALRLGYRRMTAWMNKCWILIALKRYEDALTVADHAIRFDPDDPSAWYCRGCSLSALKRHADALQAFDQTIALSPDYGDAWVNKGIMLAHLHRYDEAFFAAKRAVGLCLNSSVAWTNLGFVLTQLQHVEESLHMFEKALSLDANDATALSNTGEALHTLGRSAEGMPYVDRALELSPDDPEFLTTRGQILLALNRPDDALVTLDRALAIDPGHAETWRQKAAALHVLGREDEAHEAERRAADLDE